MSETSVVNSILNYYALYPSYVKLWRANTGAGTFQNKSGSERFVRFMKKGFPDIFGIRYDGKFIAIECKFGKNKLNETQKEFKALFEGMNAIYILAYSLDDVIAVLKPEVR